MPAIREYYDKLLSAKRSFDFFGKAESETDLKKKFRDISKHIHPDTVAPSDRYIALEAFQILNRLYNEGVKEMAAGIYGIVDPIKLYQKRSPLFELKVKGQTYEFFENVFEGEVASIYRGTCGGELAYMKLCLDPADNDLLTSEYNILTTNRHQLLPYVEAKITVNGCTALLMREVKGEALSDFMQKYPKGIPAEHVMWMLERLLNVVGWLHSNKVVHGNIKPENIIIDKNVHRVTLLGLAFAIEHANEETAQYKIVNDYYTAPEVNKDARVLPCSDIYSIGKVAVNMLGGSIKNGAMPITIDPRIRAFVRKMLAEEPYSRPGDAWKLWDELIKLRTEVYGKRRFLTLD